MPVSSTSSSLSLFSVGTLDVSSLVSQLMTIEQQPLNALQKNESKLQSKISAYGQVSSALSSLDSALSSLRNASTFQVVSPSVTGTSVSAVGSGTSGAAGAYTVNVSTLARGQSTASAAMSSTTTLGAGTLTLTRGTTTVNIDTGGSGQPTTLTELRNAINSNATLGVKASLVNDGTQQRLVLNSSDTGTANAFTASGSGALSGFAFSTQQTAQDAAYSINGLPLTSSSNTVANAIGGVTMTLAATGSSTVTVGTDTAGIQKQVQAFVDGFNSVNSKIKSLTAYNATTKTGAVLNGESVLRRAMSQLRSVAGGAMTTSTSGDYTLMSSVGIQFQTDGTLKLDTAKFEAALKADPDKVSRLFSTSTTSSNSPMSYRDTANDGFAVRLKNAVAAMLDTQGLLGARTDGLNTELDRMKDKETRMQGELDKKQARLVQQYSRLNAQLQEMSSTSNSLANALANL